MKKKLYFIFPLIILIIALISAGVYLYIKKADDNWQSKLSKKIESYQEVIEDSSSSFESVETANDWLISWAKSKDVSYTKYGKNRDKGYGYEALRLILNHAFISMHMERVTLDYMTANKKAEHLYEKIGVFKREFR